MLAVFTLHNALQLHSCSSCLPAGLSELNACPYLQLPWLCFDMTNTHPLTETKMEAEIEAHLSHEWCQVQP